MQRYEKPYRDPLDTGNVYASVTVHLHIELKKECNGWEARKLDALLERINNQVKREIKKALKVGKVVNGTHVYDFCGTDMELYNDHSNQCVDEDGRTRYLLLIADDDESVKRESEMEVEDEWAEMSIQERRKIIREIRAEKKKRWDKSNYVTIEKDKSV